MLQRFTFYEKEKRDGENKNSLSCGNCENGEKKIRD
jgi:hypothetical protein